MATTITPEQVAPQLRQIKGSVPKSMGSAFRRGVARIRSSTVKSIMSKGIGKKLWGGGGDWKRNPGAVKKLVVGGKVQERNGTYSVDLTLKGFPAMMEEGGQTQPHEIKPKNAPVLAYVSAGEARFASGPVDHPGSRIPRDPSLSPAIDRWTPYINADIERTSQAAIARITGE